MKGKKGKVKMRVLYITNGFWGSGEANMVQSHNTVAALAAQKGVAEVAFLAHSEKPRSITDLHQDFANTVGIPPCANIQMKTAVINPKSWLKTLFSVYKTLKSLDYSSYDIIYTRSREALVLFYLLGFKRFQYEAHNLEYPGSRYKRWLYRLAITRGKMKIATINKALIDDFSKVYAVDKQRLSLNTCSARCQKSKPPKIVERRYITYCGSSYPGKGFDQFVDFCRHYPELDFLAMVRSSPFIDQILPKVPKNLKVMLDCNNAEVYKYLANSYIAVAPYSENATTSGGSKNARYLSPLKVFEYMSLGCLVVAPAISAIQEILEHKVTGFLYQPRQGENLSHGVQAALDAIANGDGQNISHQVLNEFSNRYSYDARAKKIISDASLKKKPRAIYLINSFNSGGAERGVLSLLESGFFNGVDLDLITIHKGSGPLLQEIKQKGFECNIHICSQSESLTITSMLRTFYFVFLQLLKHRYRFIMLSLIQANLIGLTLACLLPRIRVITFAHNTQFSRGIYSRLLKVFSRRIDVCLYDDEETMLAYKNMLVNKASRQWIYAPLHSVVDEPLPTRNVDSKVIKILSVGRLNKQKNYLQAIEAVRILVKHGLNVELHIAGEGAQRGELEDKIKEHRLQQQVKLLGFIQDWSHLAKDMHLYLLASTHEGMSISTIEAMSLALPVVASNVGGVKSYGVHQGNMLKVMNPVAEEFAAAIERLCCDSELRLSLGEQARKDCMSTFGSTKVKEIIQHANQIVFNPALAMN